MHPETPKFAEKLPKQNKPPAQSLMSTLPLSPTGVKPRRADNISDGYVRAADKDKDSSASIFTQHCVCLALLYFLLSFHAIFDTICDCM